MASPGSWVDSSLIEGRRINRPARKKSENNESLLPFIQQPQFSEKIYTIVSPASGNTDPSLLIGCSLQNSLFWNEIIS
jgi:hypothetical protein